MSGETIKLRALLLASEERNAYGLRYQDYQRYRKHCANKTHHLRQKLKLTHGKGREFKKVPPVPIENLTDAHLQLLFFEAERAWAYSQELVQAATASKDTSTGSLTHRSTGRFRRAIHHSTQLHTYSSTLTSTSRLSPTSHLEITIYTLILRGRFLLRRDSFLESLSLLCIARDLLDTLSSTSTTSRDQALYNLFIDEIEPEIRYCAHSLGRKNAYDIGGIVKEVSPKYRESVVEGYSGLIEGLKKEGESVGSGGGGGGQLDSLMWEGQPVPLRNPELADVFLKVQVAEKTLSEGIAVASQLEGGKGKKVKESDSRGRITSYDQVLLALSDAEEVARKLTEAQQLSGGGSVQSAPGGGTPRDIHFVHAYIVYQLLSRRIERDLLLMSSLLGPTSKTEVVEERADPRLYPALVKILDTILQSLEQMRNLSIVDESPDLVSAIEGRLAFAKARRCMYLSRTYSSIKRFAEALTLTSRAHLHLRESRSILSVPLSSEGATSFFPLVFPSSIDTLESELGGLELRTKIDWFGYNGGAGGSGDGEGVKKPLFFDIAFNYAELPMDRLMERAGKGPAAAPAGSSAGPTSSPVVPTVSLAEKEKRAAEVVEEKEVVPSAEPAKGGLGGLLGGWWGRK